jgi:hypothetical protein
MSTASKTLYQMLRKRICVVVICRGAPWGSSSCAEAALGHDEAPSRRQQVVALTEEDLLPPIGVGDGDQPAATDAVAGRDAAL